MRATRRELVAGPAGKSNVQLTILGTPRGGRSSWRTASLFGGSLDNSSRADPGACLVESAIGVAAELAAWAQARARDEGRGEVEDLPAVLNFLK